LIDVNNHYAASVNMATQNRWIPSGPSSITVIECAGKNYDLKQTADVLEVDYTNPTIQRSIKRQADKLHVVIHPPAKVEQRLMSDARFKEICWASTREATGSRELSGFEQAAIKYQPKQYTDSDTYWKRICPPGFDSIEWAKVLQIADFMPVEYLIKSQDNERKNRIKAEWTDKRRSSKSVVPYRESLQTSVDMHQRPSRDDYSKATAIPYQDDDGEAGSDLVTLANAPAECVSRYRYDSSSCDEDARMKADLAAFQSRLRAGKLDIGVKRTLKDGQRKEDLPKGQRPASENELIRASAAQDMHHVFIYPRITRPEPPALAIVQYKTGREDYPTFPVITTMYGAMQHDRQIRRQVAAVLQVPEPPPQPQIPNRKESRPLTGWGLYSAICTERRRLNDLEPDVIKWRQV
jgi:hypothetical protein